MPRSFLVRNYFKKSSNSDDDEEEREDEAFDETQYLFSSLLHPYLSSGYVTEDGRRVKIETPTWNYELEKAYWFEVADNNKNVSSVDSDRSESKGNLLHNEIKNSNNINNNNNDVDARKVKQDAFQGEERNSSQKNGQLGASSETLAWDNLDEKLNQMLDEDPDIVVRNIRQFLENNRILLNEITVETGLAKEKVKEFMESNINLESNQRKEFYRWYLTKILRPPKGTDEDSYTCFKCGKIFAYESYLERHIKYVCPDNSGRTWKCSYCGKAFQYPCYLRRHIRSHTGESPYKCDKCGRAFVRSTDLQRHIRNHTGEKPYKCTQCERAFARSTDLKRHMRTHTGEKPYKCWQCGKTFSQSGSLQTHLHTHNKDAAGGKKVVRISKENVSPKQMDDERI